MKIYLDSIGCRLNQAEIERYARQFRAAGHTLVSNPAQAQLAVVNTCAVTSAAESDSRQKIRQIHRAGVDEIIATGCWATLQPADTAALPGVKLVIANRDKDELTSRLLQIPIDDGTYPDINPMPGTELNIFDMEPGEREPIPGARLRTRAFIKVQDGCDNRCTFCITTIARGPSRSRPMVEILRDIRSAESANEIVLTGVHLGSWGKDFSPPLHLSQLVQALLKETAAPRLRLSSLEPWDLDHDFFDLWEDPRLCRHLHLPLQSGSQATLRRMARKTSPSSFADLVQAARLAVPDMAITTDIIAGFPGETEAEFQESLDFVRAMNFAGGHVFTYSSRPGVAAERMPDQVPHAVRKERNSQMRLALSQSASDYQQGFIGAVLPVLWESAVGLGTQGWEMSGLTGNYLRVRAHAPRRLWNQITPVWLSEKNADGLFGQIQIG